MDKLYMIIQAIFAISYLIYSIIYYVKVKKTNNIKERKDNTLDSNLVLVTLISILTVGIMNFIINGSFKEIAWLWTIGNAIGVWSIVSLVSMKKNIKYSLVVQMLTVIIINISFFNYL